MGEDAADELRESNPTIPRELDDRAADNWRPMLAIADRVGNGWASKTRQTACLLAKRRDERDELGVRLLSDIHVIFQEKEQDRIPTSELLRWLTTGSREWGEYLDGKPISASSSHSQFGGQKRILKGFERAMFEDAWAR